METAKRTEFLDLPLECQKLAINDLDLFDLTVLIETNHQLSSLAHDMIVRRLAKKTVVFSSPYFTTTKKEFIHEDDVHIRIRNLPIVYNVLKRFGQYIKNLEIDHYFLDERAKTIYELVNMYCSKTLTGIHLKNVMEDFLKEFSQPFKAVKKVHLEGDLRNFGDLRLTINELFPEMRQLQLGQVKFTDTESIAQNFPHLQEFDVDIFPATIPGRVTEDVVEHVIHENHQIRNLILRHASPSVVDYVHTEMPDATHIELIDEE